VYGGQTYNTVQIGTQCWLKENLNIGTKIPSDQEQTNNGTIEKYCYYNDQANCTLFGGLYQWNEMMQYLITEGVQGICPPGWHVPTNGEWTALTGFLGGLSVAGGKMKSTGTIEAGTGLWYSPNAGATNESGFTAVPAGYRRTFGGFNEIGSNGYLSCSSETTQVHAGTQIIHYSGSSVTTNPMSKDYGFSVRCLKD
jgi:uncharacterized protein (TIGR02145 family)